MFSPNYTIEFWKQKETAAFLPVYPYSEVSMKPN